MITLTGLAKKLGINESTLSMRISKIPNFRSKYAKKVHGSLFINDDGIKIITRGYKTSPRRKSDKTAAQYAVKINSLMRTLSVEKRVNNQLKKTLTDVNNALKRSNGSEERLEGLLNQQQQLQLTSYRRNSELKGQIKILKGQLNRKQPTKVKAHRSFWKRIFSFK